jgi:hypothetical protein
MIYEIYFSYYKNILYDTNYNTTPHPHHLFIISYKSSSIFTHAHTTLILRRTSYEYDMSYSITVGVPSLYDTLHFFIVIIFIRVIFILPMFLTSIRSF